MKKPESFYDSTCQYIPGHNITIYCFTTLPVQLLPFPSPNHPIIKKMQGCLPGNIRYQALPEPGTVCLSCDIYLPAGTVVAGEGAGVGSSSSILLQYYQSTSYTSAVD